MINLKEILDENSTAPHDLMQHLRLSQVEHKIKVRRQRRIAAGSICSLVVLAILGYAVTSRPTAAPLPPSASPTPAVQEIHGFPEYDHGRHVIAATSAPFSNRPVSLTWTPTTWDTLVEVRCRYVPGRMDIHVKIEINGKPFREEQGFCNQSIMNGQESLSKVGVKLGEPSIVTATVIGALDRTEPTSAKVDAPTVGTLALALWNDVPFADYPFPARPAQLKPLSEQRLCEEAGADPKLDLNVLHSDPADPARPMTMKVIWKGSFLRLAAAQTPGHLRIAINGVEVEKETWWGYQSNQAIAGWATADKGWQTWKVPGWIHPRQGEEVTVTVTPEGLSGAWKVRLAPTKDPDGFCSTQ